MHPQLIAFELAGRPVVIGSYGVLLAVALSLAALALLRAARALQLELGAAITASGTAVGAALAGAVAVHALLAFVEHGALLPGLSMFGALLGGGAGLWCATRALAPGLDPLALAGRALPALVFAQAVARAGCWLGGCCYGSPLHASFAATIAGSQLELVVERHPLALYEAASLSVLALAFALRARTRARSHRTTALHYLALYAGLRLLLDALRDPAAGGPAHAHALGASQAAALSLLTASVLALAALALRARFWHGASAR